jgi:hypothetical protein
MNMPGPLFALPIDLVVKIDADETECEKVVFSTELRTKDLPVFPTAAAVGAARLPEPTLPVEVVVFDDCGDMQLETLEFTDVARQLLLLICQAPSAKNPSRAVVGGEGSSWSLIQTTRFTRLQKTITATNLVWIAMGRTPQTRGLLQRR